MKILNILNKPHPFIFDRYSVLLPSIITFLILVLLKPLEFDTFSIIQLIVWSLVFSAIIGITIFFCVSAVILLFGRPITEKWKVIDEISLFIFVLLMMALVIFLLFLVLNPNVNQVDLFSSIVLRVFTIGLFPVLILVLYEQNHYKKIKLSQIEHINQQLHTKKHVFTQNKHITSLTEKIVLLAENEKIVLKISPTNLYLVKSEGNYVEVFYKNNTKNQKLLIRNSMKAIEAQLSGQYFFRCHNRFLININFIQRIERNTRNIELVLENFDEKIPVSRSKHEILLKLFNKNNIFNIQ